MKDIDRRAWPGLLAGLLGLALGIGSGVFSNLLLGVLAGCAALVACAAALSLLGQLNRAEVALAGAVAAAEDRDTESLLDTETGLPDDEFFALVLEGRVALARRKLHPLSLVLVRLDLDQRRRPGATLRAFVEVLRQTLREADVACRLGPSTFALVLEDTPEDGGVLVAERIHQALARVAPAAVSIAAGVATYPIHGLGVDELIARADAALNLAGTRGLGAVEVAPADYN